MLRKEMECFAYCSEALLGDSFDIQSTAVKTRADDILQVMDCLDS